MNLKKKIIVLLSAIIAASFMVSITIPSIVCADETYQINDVNFSIANGEDFELRAAIEMAKCFLKNDPSKKLTDEDIKYDLLNVLTCEKDKDGKRLFKKYSLLDKDGKRLFGEFFPLDKEDDKSSELIELPFDTLINVWLVWAYLKSAYYDCKFIGELYFKNNDYWRYRLLDDKDSDFPYKIENGSILLSGKICNLIFNWEITLNRYICINKMPLIAEVAFPKAHKNLESSVILITGYKTDDCGKLTRILYCPNAENESNYAEMDIETFENACIAFGGVFLLD